MGRQYMAIWFVQSVGMQLRVIDFAGQPENIGALCKDVAGQEYIYDMHHLPHDASHGNLGTGKTTLEMLRAWP